MQASRRERGVNDFIGGLVPLAANLSPPKEPSATEDNRFTRISCNRASKCSLRQTSLAAAHVYQSDSASPHPCHGISESVDALKGTGFSPYIKSTKSTGL